MNQAFCIFKFQSKAYLYLPFDFILSDRISRSRKKKEVVMMMTITMTMTMTMTKKKKKKQTDIDIYINLDDSYWAFGQVAYHSCK